MSPRKRKSVVGSPEKYNQKLIVDYFRQSSGPKMNRKLLIEDAGSKLAIHKGKLVDTDCDHSRDSFQEKVSLPCPLSSDDEDASGFDDVRKKQPEKEKGLGSRAVGTSTMIELNRPSCSHSKQQIMPLASSTPSKTNSRCESMLISGEKSQSKNVHILESISLTPEKTRQPISEESPYKRKRMDVTLSEDRTLKVQLDIGIRVAGDSIQDIPISQEKLQSIPIVIRGYSPASHKTENVTLQTPSSSSNQIKNEISRSSSTPVRRRLNLSPKVLKENSLKPEYTKLNVEQFEPLKKLYREALENMDKRKLLTETDIGVVTEFLKMDVNHQYLLMNLFLYPTWHNMRNFCNEKQLDQTLTCTEITSMYEYFKKSRFVDTDLSHLRPDELLNLLTIPELKRVARDLKVDSKKSRARSEIIKYLNLNCKVQTTLTMQKSSEDVLKEAACKHLGDCIKLKKDVWSSLNKVFVLQTCTNDSYYKDVPKFLKDACYDKVVYPNYHTFGKYIPFKNQEQYSRFYNAVRMNEEFNHAVKNKADVTAKNLCDESFKMLISIDDNGKWNRYLPIHLQKFSAEYWYISLLKSGIVEFTSNHVEDVKIWIEFLIEHYPTNSATGFWYKHLASITLQHDKEYESAAKIIIEALEFNKVKGNIFNLVQIYELNEIAHKIRTTKSYLVCTLYRDQLTSLSEVSVDNINILKKPIEVSRGPKSRIYNYSDSNKKTTSGSFEDIAMIYYSDNERFKGALYGEKLIHILFTLFFWDIIYIYYVPYTFISKLQSSPLDMYSESFYQNRKTEIDKRLEEIARGWSDEKFKRELEGNWKSHSHEKSIADFEGLGEELTEILIMCSCIERSVLSKIFGRLVSNYEVFGCGFPDLFLWNAELKKCKFVTVKKKDHLQPSEILWIQHLIEVGAEVEVCHPSETVAKKNSKKTE